MIELARCHICASILPDEKEDRADHIGYHKHIDKRLDAMTRSLNYLNGEIEKAFARIAELEQQVPAAGDGVGLTINEFPDDELDDDTTTDLADLADINPQNIEILAAETDDLDERIANLSGVAPTVAGA